MCGVEADYHYHCLAAESSQERKEEKEMNFDCTLTESLGSGKEGYEAESEKSHQ